MIQGLIMLLCSISWTTTILNARDTFLLLSLWRFNRRIGQNFALTLLQCCLCSCYSIDEQNLTAKSSWQEITERKNENFSNNFHLNFTRKGFALSDRQAEAISLPFQNPPATEILSLHPAETGREIENCVEILIKLKFPLENNVLPLITKFEKQLTFRLKLCCRRMEIWILIARQHQDPSCEAFEFSFSSWQSGRVFKSNVNDDRKRTSPEKTNWILGKKIFSRHFRREFIMKFYALGDFVKEKGKEVEGVGGER